MREVHAPEHDAASIVLVGAFNPGQFQPAWFSSQGLLPSDEAESASIQLINNDFCLFETSWVRIEVVSQRWMARSVSVPIYEPLRDLALGTLSALPGNPVSKIGLNSHSHYSAPSRAQYDSFGHSLVPKEEIWQPILEDPRTLSVHVEGLRPDNHKGRVRVKVEPSTVVDEGVFLDVNDEFISDDDAPPDWHLRVIGDEWDRHRERVAEIKRGIVSKLWEES